MSNNQKFNRWIGLYILLLIMLPSALSYNNITYVEDEDMLQVWSFWSSYNNGAIVQLLKQVNDTCFEPRMFVRNIYQNGTSSRLPSNILGLSLIFVEFPNLWDIQFPHNGFVVVRSLFRSLEKPISLTDCETAFIKFIH